MALAVVMLPLISSITVGMWGRLLGARGGGILATLSMAVTAILAIMVSSNICKGGELVVIGASEYWVDMGWLTAGLGVRIDCFSAPLLFLISTISFLVHWYSLSYMANDPHVSRFFSYLSLFTFFMIILVTGDNLLLLFVGWEGVGVCSYLLIGFWYTRIPAAKSGLKAMIMNRCGDLGLLLGVIVVYSTFGALDYETIYTLAPTIDPAVAKVAGILFFIAAVGKSAQLGLHTWLADAMAGPTPVSALIHSATMVTAGVFLLIRLAPLLLMGEDALTVITIGGALTAAYGASVALFQYDIKSVIAYSTCSQLGYMVLACGIGQFSLALMHLLTHGFFKSLLFLSAGSIIHPLREEQDLRRMGALASAQPASFPIVLTASLSLAGIPFLGGFYTKETIIESAHGGWVWALASFAVVLTALYSVKLIYLAFVVTANRPEGTPRDPEMAIPLILWAAGLILLPRLAPAVEWLPLLGLAYLLPWPRVYQSFTSNAWYIDWLYNRLIGRFVAGCGIFKLPETYPTPLPHPSGRLYHYTVPVAAAAAFALAIAAY